MKEPRHRPSRKHHYVPQFALRYWAEGDGKVPYYMRRGGRIVRDRLTPEYTGYDPDLYAFVDVPSESRHRLEIEFFGRLESDVAPIYKKIESRDEHLLGRERRLWAMFLLAAIIRVPEKVALTKRIVDKHVQRALAASPEEYLAVKGDEKEETLTEWVQNNVSGIENLGLVQVAKFIMSEDRQREFLELEWIVHGVEHANVELLLGDRPLWTYKHPSDPDFIAMMPLSPRSVFIAARNDRVIKKTISSSANELTRRVNESVAGSAWERVYGRAPLGFLDRCMRQSESIEEAVNVAMENTRE